ncbi:hypothetical protein BDFB_014273, partial [Asbolus verrucosus]
MEYVVFAEAHFLRKYTDNLQSNLPLQWVYLDENWIFENGTVLKSWQDDSHRSARGIQQICLNLNSSPMHH